MHALRGCCSAAAFTRTAFFLRSAMNYGGARKILDLSEVTLWTSRWFASWFAAKKRAFNWPRALPTSASAAKKPPRNLRRGADLNLGELRKKGVEAKEIWQPDFQPSAASRYTLYRTDTAEGSFSEWVQRFPVSMEMFSFITSSASCSRSRRTSGRNQSSPLGFFRFLQCFPCFLQVTSAPESDLYASSSRQCGRRQRTVPDGSLKVRSVKTQQLSDFGCR